MNQLKQLKQLDKASYFNKLTLSQVIRVNDNALYKNIKRWLKSENLIQIKRGMYVTKEYWQAQQNNNSYCEFLANQIKTPSYLSLEYVLQKHTLLTEVVYAYTSVTIKKPNQYTNKMGQFLYYKIKPELFMGYQTKQTGGFLVREASLAKALFDYFYLKLRSVKIVNKDLLDSFRLNLDLISQEQKQEFSSYLKLSGSAKMKLVGDWLC